MTLKVYSVKSNARRDARKLGLDPLSVVAEGGGFVIGALRSPAPVPVSGKQSALQALLEAGWKALPDLAASLSWQAHTVRGVISRIGKDPTLTVERKRENGVLSYRVVRS